MENLGYNLRYKFLTTILLLYIQTLNADNGDNTFKQMVWAIDTPEALTDGAEVSSAAVDLSNAVIQGSTERKYHLYGDSLISRVSEGVREWFSVADDTVYRTATNDRVYMTFSDCGIPYRFGLSSAPDVHKQGITIIRYSSMTDDSSPLSAQVAVEEGIRFVFSPNDTIESYCIRTDTKTDSIHTTERRWYTDGCVFPVVEHVGVKTASGETLSRTFICPPSEQDASTLSAWSANTAQMLRKANRGFLHDVQEKDLSEILDYNTSLLHSAFDISTSGNELQITKKNWE